MRAAVCHAFGAPLRIEELDLAPPQAGEILVRVRACGICHSDIAFVEGAWDGRLPAVFGHEAAGVVERVGAGVDGLRAGDPVVVSLIRSCGRCPSCLRGSPVFCEATFRLDRDGPLRRPDGSPVIQGLRTAAFAEAVVVHASQAVRIPADIPLDRAALLACAVITGYGAVVTTAAVEPASSVVVIGTGGVGLNTVQAAALSGAYPVVAVDLANEKLAAARAFGASHTINPRNDDVETAVRALSNDRGADYVFVTVGVAPAIDQGLRLLRRGGTVVLVGIPASGVTTTFDPVTVANDGQRILGSKMGGARIQSDVPALIALYRSGRLKLDELVTGRYPLDRINEAIAAAAAGDALRNVIVFD